MATQLQKLQALAKKQEEERKEIERTVYYDDFVAAFKEVIEFTKKTKEELSKQSTEHKDSLESEIKEALDLFEKKVTEFSAMAEGHRAEIKEMSRSEARLLSQMFREAVGEVKSLIPEAYNDQELRELIDGVYENMPTEYDPSEILEEHEKMKKEIEELKKRPVGKGGGVSVAHVIQAMKYAVKTEAPVGDIDGANTAYTVSQPIFAVLSFSLNGEFIAQIPNYTVSGNTITFSSALPAAYSGKDFEITYF